MQDAWAALCCLLHFTFAPMTGQKAVAERTATIQTEIVADSESQAYQFSIARSTTAVLRAGLYRDARLALHVLHSQ